MVVVVVVETVGGSLRRAPVPCNGYVINIIKKVKYDLTCTY